MHELPRKILEYRAVQKLKSTYVDALPAARQPRDRAHPRHLQPDGGGHRAALAPPTPTCRTSPSAPRKGGASARPSWPSPATCSSPPTTARSSCGSWPTSPRTRRSSTPSAAGRTCTTARRARSSAPSRPVRRTSSAGVAKMVNYALLYGKTAFTLAKDIGVEQEGGRAVHRGLLRALPVGARSFIDETIARGPGDGARAHAARPAAPAARPAGPRTSRCAMEAERQAMNTPVQGSAADLIKKAMIDLHRRAGPAGHEARGSSCRSTTSCCSRCRRRRRKRRGRWCSEVMEGALALDVPLVADARLGRRAGRQCTEMRLLAEAVSLLADTGPRPGRRRSAAR